MLHALEVSGHFPDYLIRYQSVHRGDGCHVVFDVMHAGQQDLTQRQNLSAPLLIGQPDGTVTKIHTLPRAILAAEPNPLSLGSSSQLPCGLVIIVEDGTAVFILVNVNIHLGGSVLLHGTVVVQMVGRQISEHRDIRALIHGHQLEGGQLQNGKVLRLHSIHIGQQRLADIAAHKHIITCGLQKLADEGGGGGLSVTSGHCDDLAGTGAEKQFHLAGDLTPLLHSSLQLGGARLQTGGTENNILRQILQIVLPQNQTGTKTLQFLCNVLHTLAMGLISYGYIQIRTQ